MIHCLAPCSSGSTSLVPFTERTFVGLLFAVPWPVPSAGPASARVSRVSRVSARVFARVSGWVSDPSSCGGRLCLLGAGSIGAESSAPRRAAVLETRWARRGACRLSWGPPPRRRGPRLVPLVVERGLLALYGRLAGSPLLRCPLTTTNTKPE